MNAFIVNITALFNTLNNYQIAQTIIIKVIRDEKSCNDKCNAKAYELLERISIEQNDFKAAFINAQLKNQFKDNLSQFESAQKISDFKGSLSIEQIKKDIKKMIEVEKQKTALERAVKTNELLCTPTNDIITNLAAIQEQLQNHSHYAEFENYLYRMNESIKRIKDTLQTFEMNKNIIFTSYLKSNEMVEFLE